MAPALLAGERAGTSPTRAAGPYEPFRLASDPPTHLDIEATSGLVEVTFKYSSTHRVSGQFIAVSYKVDGPPDTDWSAYGLRKNLERGLFRTATGRGATGIVRQTLILPKGSKVNGISLRAIGDRNSTIKITVLSLRNLELSGEEMEP